MDRGGPAARHEPARPSVPSKFALLADAAGHRRNWRPGCVPHSSRGAVWPRSRFAGRQKAGGRVVAGGESQYLPMVAAEAERQRVPAALAAALIKNESGWNPRAVSPAGARGLGQLMPGTARGLGVSDPFDPVQSIRGAVTYLAQQLRAFGGDQAKALAAYNAGPGAVRKYGGIPPYKETQLYVAKVSASAREYERKLGGGAVAGGAVVGSATPATHAQPLLEVMVHDAGSGLHLHVAGRSDPGRHKGSAQLDAIVAELTKRGLRMTSGNRSVDANRKAGGVPNSHHLDDGTPKTGRTWARDFVGPIDKMNAAAAWLKSSAQGLGGAAASGAASAGSANDSPGDDSPGGLVDAATGWGADALGKLTSYATFALVLVAGLAVGGALIVYGTTRATGQNPVQLAARRVGGGGA